MGRLSEIESFVCVVETGSFSNAARRLNVAKSSVSRRVAELEARLGAQLINRTTRSLHLTDEGRAFHRRCAAILNDLDEAEHGVAASRHELRGTLRIAAPLSFGILHLTPLITAFLREHPHIDIEVDLRDRRIDLVAQGVDVALRIGELEDSSLIARRLAPVRAVVAAAPAFWDRVGRPQSPKKLGTLDLLRYSNVQNPGLIRYATPEGERGTVTPPLRMLASNGEMVRDAALEGLGFIVEPTFLMRDQIRSGRLEPLFLDHDWSGMSLFVVYPPTRQPSQRVRAFIDTVVARFADNPYWDEGLFPD